METIQLRYLPLSMFAVLSLLISIFTGCIINHSWDILLHRKADYPMSPLIHEELERALNTDFMYVIELNRSNYDHHRQLLIRVTPVNGDPDLFILQSDHVQQWIIKNNLTINQQGLIHTTQMDALSSLINMPIIKQSTSIGIEEVYVPDEFTFSVQKFNEMNDTTTTTNIATKNHHTTEIPLLMLVVACVNLNSLEQCIFDIQIYNVKSALISYHASQMAANINTLSYEELTMKLNHFNHDYDHDQFDYEQLSSSTRHHHGDDAETTDGDIKRELPKLMLKNFVYLGLELIAPIFDILVEALLNFV